MKAVLDTNILASGTVTSTTAPGQILDAWRGSSYQGVNLVTPNEFLQILTREDIV